MSKLDTFKGFLSRLQIEHCVSQCHHDATRCPIAKALSHNYAEFKWCPLCDGYKVGEAQATSKKKNELGDSEGYTYWLLGGAMGGLIRGYRPNGYGAIFACRCEVGQRFRIEGERIRDYDFRADEGSQNDCFQKRLNDWLVNEKRKIDARKREREKNAIREKQQNSVN